MQTCAQCGAPGQSGRFCTTCGVPLLTPFGTPYDTYSAWGAPQPPPKSTNRLAIAVLLFGVGIAVIAVLVGVAVARSSHHNENSAVGRVGPQPGRDHWHAALGVYVCDHWATDPLPDPTTGNDLPTGSWLWPGATPGGVIARAGSNEYAGLHSHNDGIIHMEPVTADESGVNATLGRYFEFGGWVVEPDHVDFLDEEVRTGGTCSGAPAVVRWSVNGRERTGNPASYKLYDNDVIVIAFVPAAEDLDRVGPSPSIDNLEGGSAPSTAPSI